MSLTADANYSRRGIPGKNEFSYPLAGNETVYRGSLVCITSGGLLQRLQTSGSVSFVGMADRALVNPTSASLLEPPVVALKGTWALPVTGASASNVGAPVYASDDNTLTMTAGTLMEVGILVGIENSQPYVELLHS